MRPVARSELQKQRLEFSNAEQGGIASGNADWEVKADNCRSGRSNFALDPIQESEVIADQRGNLRSVAVALPDSFAKPPFVAVGSPISVIDDSR